MWPSPMSVPASATTASQAPGDGVPVQRRDDGQRAALEAAGEVGDGAQEGHRRLAGVGQGEQVLQVRAGAEARAGPGDQHRAGGRVVLGVGERRGQSVDQRDVEGVAAGGSLEHQRADRPAALDAQHGGGVLGHGVTAVASRSSRRSRARWILPLAVLGRAATTWMRRG
jgi:hypothetical protein